MSYKTLEVELENGRVSAVGSESLPAKARALLTILNANSSATTTDPGRSLADLTSDLVGIGRGEHSDLSVNRDHLTDFGR